MSDEPTFKAVLDELNAIRTILFTPPIGTRLLLNEETRGRLSGHLWKIEDLCRRATPEPPSEPPPQEDVQISLDDLVADAPGPAHSLRRGAPDTERIAAFDAAGFSGRNRCRYALAIVGSPIGLTDHEAAHVCNFPAWTGAGSRRLEIVDSEGRPLVVDSGERRKSPSGKPCAVWVAKPELVKMVSENRKQIVEKAR